MKKLINFIIVLSIAAAVFGCRTPVGDNYKNLVSRTWELSEVRYSDSDQNPSIPRGVTISFSDSSTVAGRGPCNGFFGKYTTLRYDQISIDLTGSTMAFCNEMGFEDRYFKLLDNVATYEAEDRELRLQNLEETITMVFKPSTFNN